MSDTKTIEAGLYPPPGSGPTVIADPDAEIVVYPPEERYALRKGLGEGGMGEVRLCHDRVIGRDVAVKVVRDSHEHRTEIRARFEREVRVQGQLEHPAIVPVYDFGRDADGRAFFTMRRVRGVTLESVLDGLREGNAAIADEYTLHKLLAAFGRVCLAIQFASEHGVVHRDLKPSNIMLGRHGEVYVLDWGLATVRGGAVDSPVQAPRVESEDEPPPSSARFISGVSGMSTIAGAVLGTPLYMSPEQIRGEELDGRSDVYALGAILFEILTLKPFHGEGAVGEILERATRGVDAGAALRASDRDVVPELELVCARATAREKASRLGTARELADLIEAYLSGDRDLALRRELAKVHVERAREAAARARVPGAPHSHRAEALRETGQAIALAPTDAEARSLLVQLLTEPPAETPEEVSAALVEEDRQSRVKLLPRVAFTVVFTSVIAFAIHFVVGMNDWATTVACNLLWLVAAASTWIAHRFDRNAAGSFPYVTGLLALALAATTLLNGSLLFAPTAGTALAIGTALMASRKTIRFGIYAAALAAVGPVLLSWAGLHPVHEVFHDGALTISGTAVKLERHGTFAFLSGTYLLIILLCARFASAYREALADARLRNKVQAWQLQQLVPDDAARAMGGLTESVDAKTNGPLRPRA